MFEKSSLGEQVAEALKDEILSGRLAPRQRIDIGRYASSWNVSSTPMRDAVKRLEAAGLVEVSPRRGVFVSGIDRQELREIFELRTALESLAIRSATERMPAAEAERALRLYRSAEDAPDEQDRDRILGDIDSLIHDLAVEYCGNRRLIELIENLRALINWSRKHADQPPRAPLRGSAAGAHRDRRGTTRARWRTGRGGHAGTSGKLLRPDCDGPRRASGRARRRGYCWC